VLRQFGANVAVAIENARLLEHERQYTSTLETLAEVARDFGSILNLDELLTRLASVTRRIVDYRTFGILLVNDATQELELKTAVRYGDQRVPTHVKIGDGLVGYAALHKEPVLVPDVSADPRYIRVVEDIRSELVIPLMLKDRCIGVFDLESPELDAFKKSDVEILTLLASQAAVAIENAGCMRTIRTNEIRLENPLRAAGAGGAPADRAAQTAEGRRRGRQVRTPTSSEATYDFSHRATIARARRRRRLGQGSGGVVALCGRAGAVSHFRRRYTSERSSPAGVLASMNTILRAPARAVTARFATRFDLKRRSVTIANSVTVSGALQRQTRPDRASGCPLSVRGCARRSVIRPRRRRRLRLLHGRVFETTDARGQEFGVERLTEVVLQARKQTAAPLSMRCPVPSATSR
jgi:sigma-B regulation protein RsbU (phosphoserine phosphatase)